MGLNYVIVLLLRPAFAFVCAICVLSSIHYCAPVREKALRIVLCLGKGFGFSDKVRGWGIIWVYGRHCGFCVML